MESPQSNRPRLLESTPDAEEAVSATVWMDKPLAPPADSTEPSSHAAAHGDYLALARDSASSSPANLKRGDLMQRHLVISLAASLLTGAAVLGVGKWFYDHEIVPRLNRGAVSSPAAVAPAPKVEVTGSSQEEEIAELRRQLDVIRREQLLNQQNTREALERITATLESSRPVPATAPVPAPAVSGSSGEPGVPRIADAVPNITPTQQEFILLKERNRLTQYADEAIATGMRKPLEAIVEYLRDPDSKHLHEAAQTEYMRAVRAIQLLQREDPGYRLPVAELFKDPAIRDEADVKPAALLKLLADTSSPWEVRVRTCFLLLGSDAPETNAALIKAIKEDPSLEVAKHAQIALEQRIKKRFRIFDIPAIEEWSKSQGK